MTIRTTRYSPDTCACILEYEWDDTTTEANRTHTLTTFINRCPAHSSLSDNDRWNTIFEENPRKNIALERSLATGPSTLYDVNADGSRQLKSAISYNHTWSGVAPNRVLTISFTGVSLTNTQKNNIRNALNTRFGVGKVTLL